MKSEKDKIDKTKDESSIDKEAESFFDGVEGPKTEMQQVISCTNLQDQFLLVRVGEKGDPATSDDIKNVQKELTELFEKNGIRCVTFVTHHAVNIDIIR